MSRLSAFVRRVFGATKPIIDQIVRDNFRVLLEEIKSGRRTRLTDDEIRDRIEASVIEYIQKRFPEYGFLAGVAIEALVSALRSALDKKR